ncbi:hypothetical protein PTKIN_Ptkin01aG0284700 [Pterospermum kingtungense]
MQLSGFEGVGKGVVTLKGILQQTRPTGIGVLKDHEGSLKLVFSKSIGDADSNLAEIKAVREAFKLFPASQWSQSHKLLIESNSLNAVKWVRTELRPLEI